MLGLLVGSMAGAYGDQEERKRLKAEEDAKMAALLDEKKNDRVYEDTKWKEREGIRVAHNQTQFENNLKKSQLQFENNRAKQIAMERVSRDEDRKDRAGQITGSILDENNITWDTYGDGTRKKAMVTNDAGEQEPLKVKSKSETSKKDLYEVFSSDDRAKIKEINKLMNDPEKWDQLPTAGQEKKANELYSLEQRVNQIKRDIYGGNTKEEKNSEPTQDKPVDKSQQLLDELTAKKNSGKHLSIKEDAMFKQLTQGLVVQKTTDIEKLIESFNKASSDVQFDDAELKQLEAYLKMDGISKQMKRKVEKAYWTSKNRNGNQNRL